MPTQAQINLAAYKSGKKPEEIQRLLQEKQGATIAPAPILPTPTAIYNPTTPTPYAKIPESVNPITGKLPSQMSYEELSNPQINPNINKAYTGAPIP
jgi:hypothetical protein